MIRMPSRQPSRTACASMSAGARAGPAARSAASRICICCWIRFSNAFAIELLFVGSARAMAAAPRIALALGYDVETELELLTPFGDS